MTLSCWRNTRMLPTSQQTIWWMGWLLWLKPILTTQTIKANSLKRVTGLVGKDTSAPVISCTLVLLAQWMLMGNGVSSFTKWPGPDTPRHNGLKLVYSLVPLAALWLLVLKVNVFKNTFTSVCCPLMHAIPRRKYLSIFTNCHRLVLVTYPVN